MQVAIEFQEANAEIPGVRSIARGTSKNNPKESEGKQGIGSNYWPRCKLTRLAHCLVILMNSQVRPNPSIHGTLEM